MTNNSHFVGKSIDLFAGAGGLSLGLHWAGWDTAFATDYDETASQTYLENFPNVSFKCCDVRDLDFSQYEGIDLIAGGPPCQPFSVAGKQLAKADERDMVPEFIRAVREARPKAFLMENVPGLVTKRHQFYLSWVTEQFESLGYKVHVGKLNAASFGVAQNRHRIFFVGVPKDVRFVFPEAQYGKGKGLKPYVTVTESLQNVPEDEPNKAIVTYAKNPILRPSPWAGMLVNGKGRPLNPEAPSPTIPATAGGNRTHIIDPEGILFDYHGYLQKGGSPKKGVVEGVRRLTARESARLQSFPDDFLFSGKKSSRFRQIGNAVPPLLAQAVARSLSSALFSSNKVNGFVSLPVQRLLFKEDSFINYEASGSK